MAALGERGAWGWVLSLALRALACAGVFMAVHAWLESVALALLFTAVPLALAFHGPIIEGASALGRWMHALAWRDVAGRHHAFQGQAVDVRADGEGQAWLATPGLRRILPGLPADDHLAHLLGERWQPASHGDVARLRADALDELLARATEPRTLRFRHWLQRDVVFPARRRFERGL